MERTSLCHALNSTVSVVLNDDGISRHISHIRRVPPPIGDSSEEDNEESVDGEGGAIIGARTGRSSVRRSTRARQPLIWSYDYDMY